MTRELRRKVSAIFYEKLRVDRVMAHRQHPVSGSVFVLQVVGCFEIVPLVVVNGPVLVQVDG
jgi:hypothetical protein